MRTLELLALASVCALTVPLTGCATSSDTNPPGTDQDSSIDTGSGFDTGSPGGDSAIVLDSSADSSGDDTGTNDATDAATGDDASSEAATDASGDDADAPSADADAAAGDSVVSVDSGTDSGAADSVASDSAVADTSATDSTSTDTGVVDASTDTAVVDSGADTGVADTGVADSGTDGGSVCVGDSFIAAGDASGTTPDRTTGNTCTSSTTCDVSGSGLSFCTGSGYAIGALDPTPVCEQGTTTGTDACDPGPLDSSGNQTQLRLCDGDTGLCTKSGTNASMCEAYCEMDDTGAWIKQCAGKNACSPWALGTDSCGVNFLVGTCYGGCSADTDCPSGNVCDAVAKVCVGVSCASDTDCTNAWSGAPSYWKCNTTTGHCGFLYPKSIGTTCDPTKTTTADCLCIPTTSNAAAGVCANACTTGRATDCPLGYACDPLLNTTSSGGNPIYAPSFAMPSGMGGYCMAKCATTADCAAGQVCELSAGMTQKTCR